ncbi:MAG: tape measure protein [Propylenella sp.]
MATDDQLLLVRIEATLRQFERQMARATGTADRTARGIETRFRAMDSRLAVVGRGFLRSFVGPLAALASGREIGQAADSFTRIENALKVAGLEGEAATAVFEQLFQAAQKNAAPVEALVTLYGRAALVQKELNVSSEELLRFTEGVAAALRLSGKSAAESSGALLQLSQALGSGVVRAEEFNSIQEGALPILQAVALGLEEAGGSVSKLRNLVLQGEVSSEAFFHAFRAGQAHVEALAESTEVTLGGALTRVRNSFIKLVGAMDETTGASGEVVGSLTDLGITIEFIADKVEGLSRDMPGWLRHLGQGIEFVNKAFGTGLILETIKRMEEAEQAVEQTAETSENAAKRIALAFEAARSVSLKDFPAPATRKSPTEQFGEDIARIRERTAALEAEAAVVGESTFVQERALSVQNLLNEAKRAGVAITPELRAAIESEAEAYARAVDLLERTEEKHRQIAELGAFVGDSFLQAFRDIVPAIETGNRALDGLINRLVEAIANAAILGEGAMGGVFGVKGPARKKARLAHRTLLREGKTGAPKEPVFAGAANASPKAAPPPARGSRFRGPA